MKDLEGRITTLETQLEVHVMGHEIPVLAEYPRRLSDEAMKVWRVQAVACTYQPGCREMCVRIWLPAKGPIGETQKAPGAPGSPDGLLCHPS